MYSEEDLESAVTAGVLSADAVAGFRAHVATTRKGFQADEEHFRLITGFNDIFVVIASLLLLAAVAWIGGSLHPFVGAAGVVAVSWVLSEYFVRERRMALPAIVLMVTFVAGVYVTVIFPLAAADKYVTLTVAAAVSLVAAWLHWMRFHVPITVAAGAAMLVLTLVTSIRSAAPSLRDWTGVLLFVAGIVVFLLALRWDASDAARRTRRSDVAFWLHLLAAPLIVHPVFLNLGASGGLSGGAQALAIFAVYLGIAFVSLAIDRRALMVSALGYVLYAFTGLLQGVGNVGFGFALTALVIGLGLLILSAFWQQSRAFAVQKLPRALRDRLPVTQT